VQTRRDPFIVDETTKYRGADSRHVPHFAEIRNIIISMAEEAVAMTPGPIKIIKCPNCGGLACYGTLRSGNTIGARTWTDGRQIAPMLPHPPAVVKCSQCPECYWLSGAETVGEYDPWDREAPPADPSWKNVESIEEPTEEEYAKALAGTLASTPKEVRSLRILAWWRANDPYRNQLDLMRVSRQPHSKSFRSNLESLVGLMKDGEVNDLLMKAEILRELGRFDEAESVLRRVISPSYAAVAQQLRELCEQKDTGVRELQFDS
jgi:hypothetical protein